MAATDKLGFNALHYASVKGNINVFSVLLSTTDLIQPPIYPIHLAAYFGHSDAIHLLGKIS